MAGWGHVWPKFTFLEREPELCPPTQTLIGEAGPLRPQWDRIQSREQKGRQEGQGLREAGHLGRDPGPCACPFRPGARVPGRGRTENIHQRLGCP